MNRLLTPQAAALFLLAAGVSACNHPDSAAKTSAPPAQTDVTVSTALVKTQPVAQYLTLSSELVADQEVDVYAKVAGYVKTLNVDYGVRVHKGQVMATLEVPELQAQLDEDTASIKAQQDQVSRTESDVERVKTQHIMLHRQYERLAGVAKSNAGMIAQQEVDDAQSKDLAAESLIASTQGVNLAAQSQLSVVTARLAHDQALYDYSKIVAPFDGVVTQRYANFGALMQAGTSSTQATPLVRLSDVRTLRLVIPIPESDVKFIQVGDPVDVRVPSTGQTVKGKIARFSENVGSATRTMHTEVDVPNASGKLIPGTYAEADVRLSHSGAALVVPLQALDRSGDKASLMVVTAGNQIETRPVTPGVQLAEVVEITSGVSEGDRVVVSDRSGLKAGETVVARPLQALPYDGSTAK